MGAVTTRGAERGLALAGGVLLLAATAAGAQSRPAAPNDLPSTAPTPNCPSCAEWNAPHAPVRLFANTWFVGTNGLSAILVTSSAGHVLIDGGLAESAPLIEANVRAAGFRVEDVRLILNSHVHYDHAAGIAYLQRRSGASVAARAPSASVLRLGRSDPTDPQHGTLAPFAPVANVRVVAAGETVRVGPLALTAHATAGHTPGGTTWTWRSCDGAGAAARCLDFVYADSQTPVSADGFLYSRSTTYPTGVEDFRRGADLIERLPCDVLVTPHPSASRLWERVAARDGGRADALVVRGACRRYAATARQALARRLAEERGR